MKFIKKPISMLERLRWIIHAIEWIPLTNLPCYDHDAKKWHEVRPDLKERLDCFLGGLETAIIGYVYAVKID
jgi:hypothetical protein